MGFFGFFFFPFSLRVSYFKTVLVILLILHDGQKFQMEQHILIDPLHQYTVTSGLFFDTCRIYLLVLQVNKMTIKDQYLNY